MGGAITALGKLGDARAVDVLCELLADEDILIRQSAARARGVLGHPRALDALIAAAARQRWYYRRPHTKAIRELRRRYP